MWRVEVSCGVVYSGVCGVVCSVEVRYVVVCSGAYGMLGAFGVNDMV